MQRQIVLQLQSLKFVGSVEGGDGPIRLRDAHSDEWIDAQPEWVKGVRSEPAAYVRGRQPSVEIGLQVGWFAPEEFEISAWGAWPTGQGAPTVFSQILGPYRVQPSQHDRRRRFASGGIARFNHPLPDRIGRHAVELDWYAEWSEGSVRRSLFLGHTSHVLCTTWEPMVNDADRHLHSWAYSKVMEWSCAWASGATKPKQICDLLLENLPACGLLYGLPGWDVRSMLVDGGGMCGGWYQLFAQLANCQGVALSLQTLMLPEAGEWSGLVVTDPGTNQVLPSFMAGVQGHYRDSPTWPVPPPETLTSETTRRYYFPEDPDGHCVNMLENEDGTVTIYDPSFLLTASGVRMRVPPKSGRVDHFERGSSFRTQYFEPAVPFLVSRTARPPGDDPLAFGVTVKSEVIPTISLVWNQEPAPEVTRREAIDKLRRVVATYVTDPAEAASWDNRIRRLETNPTHASGPILTAVDAARELPARQDALVPHSMPTSELLQHSLLELLQTQDTVMENDVSMAMGGGSDEDAEDEMLTRVEQEAVSPRLRALARRLL